MSAIKQGGQRTLDGGTLELPDETLVDTATESKGERLLLVACPAEDCDTDWRLAYALGEHDIDVVEAHLQREHAVDSEPASERPAVADDRENHTLPGGDA